MAMDRRTFLKSVAALASTPAFGAARRPNILVILADDVGYSDIGCYGGEIHTPNLDRLAAGGVRFTQAYNCARCCPSRAALLTGLYPHQAGMGNMVGGRRDESLDGYQGRLNDRNVTIAEVLRPAGYSTIMTGKWHLAEPGPVERGFGEYYGMLHGFDSFWDASKYIRLPEGRPQRSYGPGKFYATDAITDYTLDLLAGARRQKKPWFTYLAYNAAHFPLHAPKDLIDKYAPVYEKGWDRIRQERFERMRRMGLLERGWDFTPRSIIPPNRVATPNGWANKQNPAWDSLDADRGKDLARRMAIYAAMIEIMDRNIGRVIGNLRAAGELNSTLVLFLCDNGACAEWDPYGFDIKSGPDNILHKGAELEKMGQPGTYHSYGSAWANASNTPFRLYKHYDHEGGISTPLIAHWPAGIRRRGVFEHQPAHLIDIMPTCVELAGARYPTEFGGKPILAMEGRSLTPAFEGRTIDRQMICWEHEGNRAIRVGMWKAVALDPAGEWELYDMERDRTEMHNLAAQEPGRLKEMVVQWESWAHRTKTIPWIWNPQYGEKTP
jgi:arylsulfatase A-like enzyme